jgi:hypothetical protein
VDGGGGWRFNPILVRLQRWQLKILLELATRFQSHLGSITTTCQCAPTACTPLVSIPSWFDYNTGTPIANRPIELVSIPSWFDYNSGSLPSAPNRGGFQSHLGSITTMERARAVLVLGPVSIPSWFDYNPRDPARRELETAFQSHLGSITTCPPPPRVWCVGGVSIPSWFDYNPRGRWQLEILLQRFNPILVRLQLGRQPASARALGAGFNPILVRLQRGVLGALSALPGVSIPSWFDYNRHNITTACRPSVMFQSHLGSITTASGLLAVAGASVSVSIPSWFDYNLPAPLPRLPVPPGFNPILVRLQPIACTPSRRGLSMFQSHLGSITTCFQWKRCWECEPVSIPSWFDYNPKKASARWRAVWFQSHLGSITTVP